MENGLQVFSFGCRKVRIVVVDGIPAFAAKGVVGPA
jgi:prophage antirepressor-like protein